MNDKLTQYIQNLQQKRNSLVNQSAISALDSVVLKYQGNEVEGEKHKIISLVNYFQADILAGVIKELSGILAPDSVKLVDSNVNSGI